MSYKEVLLFCATSYETVNEKLRVMFLARKSVSARIVLNSGLQYPVTTDQDLFLKRDRLRVFLYWTSYYVLQ